MFSYCSYESFASACLKAGRHGGGDENMSSSVLTPGDLWAGALHKCSKNPQS